MGQGLEVFNADSSLQFSTGARLTRILGSRVVTADGSISVTLNAGAKLFAYILAGRETRLINTVPVVTVSGNTVSWSLGGPVANFGYAGVNNVLVWGEF